MPTKERELRRLFYELKDVKSLLDVSGPTVGVWVKYFGLTIAQRGGALKRKFTEENVTDLLAIRYLVKNELYTLKGAKIKFKLWKRKEYVIPSKYVDIPYDVSRVSLGNLLAKV